MANLPNQYKWLLDESGPKMIKEALNLFDVKEKLDSPNNPVIMSWADEIGGKVKRDYHADSVAWCGLFMGIIARRANKDLPNDPLWAHSWKNFGTFTDKPMLGDVLVFKIVDGHGHVALYVGEDDTCYHILGGNQSDKVCIVRKEKSKLFVARRPNYISKPSNIRKVFLMNTGEMSVNEL